MDHDAHNPRRRAGSKSLTIHAARMAASCRIGSIRVKGRATRGLAAGGLSALWAVPPPGLEAFSAIINSCWPPQCVEAAKRATNRFCRALWKSKVSTPGRTIEARLINNWTVDPTASLGTQ
jgi:hypothetical protein